MMAVDCIHNETPGPGGTTENNRHEHGDARPDALGFCSFLRRFVSVARPWAVLFEVPAPIVESSGAGDLNRTAGHSHRDRDENFV